MIQDAEKTKKKGLFDYPEPSEDFNQTIVEASIDPHPAAVKAERPTATEYFRIYDRSGCGDISKVRKGIIISLPVKHVSTDFACFGQFEPNLDSLESSIVISMKQSNRS